MSMLSYALFLLAVGDGSCYFFSEELSVTPLSSAAPPSAAGPYSWVALTSRSALPCVCEGGLEGSGYFPAPWYDFLMHSGAVGLEASVLRGRVPFGWGLPPPFAAGPLPAATDGASGAHLLLELANPEGHSGDGPALWALWDRAARRAARAAFAGLTGSSTAPHALPLGGQAPGSSSGIVRDWYAHTSPGRRNGTVIVELNVPRAAALCTEALWGAVSASPCRGHAGLLAALSPRAIVGAPWYGLTWTATRRHSTSNNCTCSPPSGGALALELTIGVHAIVDLPGAPQLAPLHTAALVGALRSALDIPSTWGGPAMPAACPLANSSSLILRSEKGHQARLPLQSLAEKGPVHRQQQQGEEEVVHAAVPPPPHHALLRSCFHTTRTITPSYPALGTFCVLLSIHNGCSEGEWERVVREGPPAHHFAITSTAALPWMLALGAQEGTGATAAAASALAWVEEDQVGEGPAAPPTYTLAFSPAPVGPPAPPHHTRGPAALHATPPLPLPLPNHTLHYLQHLACCSGGLMHGEEGPPDAARGIEVPPARVALVRVRGEGEGEVVASWMAEGGVVELPVVDSSMPYNVIVLISTAAAFACGAMVNSLSRA